MINIIHLTKQFILQYKLQIVYYLIMGALFLSCEKKTEPPIDDEPNISEYITETTWKGIITYPDGSSDSLRVSFINNERGNYFLDRLNSGTFTYTLQTKLIEFKSSPDLKTNYFLDGVWWIMELNSDKLHIISDIRKERELKISLTRIF